MKNVALSLKNMISFMMWLSNISVLSNIFSTNMEIPYKTLMNEYQQQRHINCSYICTNIGVSRGGGAQGAMAPANECRGRKKIYVRTGVKVAPPPTPISHSDFASETFCLYLVFFYVVFYRRFCFVIFCLFKCCFPICSATG